jgi:DNA replication and repair protein RecF
MEILNLGLTNFRNFSNKKIAFDPNLTVVIGENGSGKSNILEAVALLCGVKPLRIQTDLDLVKFGKEEAKIEGKFSENSDKPTLTINFQVFDPSTHSMNSGQVNSGQASSGQARVQKAYFVDGIKKRLIDFMNLSAIVVFHPSDLDLVTGSPSTENRSRHWIVLNLLDKLI